MRVVASSFPQGQAHPQPAHAVSHTCCVVCISSACCVQGVSFLGQQDEFVMSGSDCGNFFVWDTRSGALQAMHKVGAAAAAAAAAGWLA